MNCGAAAPPKVGMMEINMKVENTAVKTKTTRHISVTLDFIRQMPGIDIRKENDLHVALYKLGFDAFKDEKGNVTGLKPFTMLNNKLVRCANMPSMYRRTTIIIGNMRPGFELSRLYEGCEILDIGLYSGADMDLVTDLPYDIPVVEKANTRKYTKKSDREDSVEVSFGTVKEVE